MSDLHKTNKNRLAPLFLSVCVGASLCSCTVQKDQQVSVAAPVVTSDKSLPGESKTTWDCVYFGSYPMSEVVESAFSAVDDYALREGDVITDPGLYAKLKNADWHNNECELDGSKFRSVKAPEDNKAREQHYQWDGGDYHYFRYEPIKWRVLEKDDQSAMLIADRLLDCEAFHTKAENVYWEDCTLRGFLNGYDSGQSKDNSFFYTAFSEEEQKGIIKTKVKNPDNHYFGTACGKDTEDYVFSRTSRRSFRRTRRSHTASPRATAWTTVPAVFSPRSMRWQKALGTARWKATGATASGSCGQAAIPTRMSTISVTSARFITGGLM